MHSKHVNQKGRIEKKVIHSKALEHNAMGDPIEREIAVYIPYGYNSNNHYPLLVEYAGYANSGLGRVSWKGFGENVPERLDRLMQDGMPPALVVFPDCFTRLGGNQYINSYLGLYANFIIDEVIPWVEQTYSCGGQGHRGCYGKSSGGYGALLHGLYYPDVWSAIGCLSGDMGFDLLFTPIMARALTILGEYDYSVENFITRFETNPNPSWPEIECLGFMCAAATFDPNPAQFLGVQLPVDPYTGEWIDERWKKWRAFDPLNLVDDYEASLKSLALLYFDCGNRDQFNLHFGARRLHQLLKSKSINHIYEEFQGDHMNLDYRLDSCLKKMIEVIQ